MILRFSICPGTGPAVQLFGEVDFSFFACLLIVLWDLHQSLFLSTYVQCALDAGISLDLTEILPEPLS